MCGLLSLCVQGRLITLKTCHDRAVADFSPGWLMLRHALEDAFVRGLAEIDLYGGMEFVRHWSRGERQFADVLLFSPTLRGRALWAAKRTRDALRARLPAGGAR